MNNYALEDEKTESGLITHGVIGRQLKRVKAAMDMAAAPSSGVTDDDVGARVTRLGSLIFENLMNNPDANIQPGGLISQIVEAIRIACLPGGPVDQCVERGIARACEPNGAISNAIARECEPGGAIERRIKRGVDRVYQPDEANML